MRESMAACGVKLPHVVVVPDADRAMFERFETEPDLRICTYTETLPSRLVQQLDRGPTLPERIRHRLTGRRFLRLHWGWMVQQYVKLGAGTVVDTPMWVCIDSDIFFLRHMDESDFHSRSGRPPVARAGRLPDRSDRDPNFETPLRRCWASTKRSSIPVFFIRPG